MSNKTQLRTQHIGTNKVVKSKKSEELLTIAVNNVLSRLQKEYPLLNIGYMKSIKNVDIIDKIKNASPNEELECFFDNTYLSPDGGFIYLLGKNANKYHILISEKKNQGTNDLRLSEGKEKQARGNAIERLGKNVIGFLSLMHGESINPFICFGDGCDFSKDSTILDRVATMAKYRRLNSIRMMNTELQSSGSYFFREKPWEVNEMETYMYEIAERSIMYYKSKYGINFFDKEQ